MLTSVSAALNTISPLCPLLFLTFYFEQLHIQGFPLKEGGGSGWADAPTLMPKILKKPSFCQMSPTKNLTPFLQIVL